MILYWLPQSVYSYIIGHHFISKICYALFLLVDNIHCRCFIFTLFLFNAHYKIAAKFTNSSLQQQSVDWYYPICDISYLLKDDGHQKLGGQGITLPVQQLQWFFNRKFNCSLVGHVFMLAVFAGPLSLINTTSQGINIFGKCFTELTILLYCILELRDIAVANTIHCMMVLIQYTGMKI